MQYSTSAYITSMTVFTYLTISSLSPTVLIRVRMTS